MVYAHSAGAGLMAVSGFAVLCFFLCGAMVLEFPVFLQWKAKPLPVYIVCWVDKKHIGKGSLETCPLDGWMCSQKDLLPEKQCA